MKPYSITEGELPHARTSIAHHRDWGNRKPIRDGTEYSRSRSTSDARGTQTGHQARRRPAGRVPPLWAEAAQIGRNRAPGDRDGLRAGSSAASAFSLSSLLASLVSGQWLVRRTQRRNDQPALTRSSPVGGMFLAVSGSKSALEETEWCPHQRRRDPSVEQSPRQAAGGAAASGGRAGMLLPCPGGPISGEGGAA